MFILYRTTNQKNGKFYIGVHSQKTEEFDGYLGSGRALKKAVAKYGKESFMRETLYMIDDKDAIFELEELAVSYVLGTDYCYNLTKGGYGNVLLGFGNKARKHSTEVNAKKGVKNNQCRLGIKGTPEECEKKRLAKIGKPSGMLGKSQRKVSCFICRKESFANLITRHIKHNHKESFKEI